MFERIMMSLLFVLVVGGFTVEICWARNLVKQTLRDEELMEAFREFGRFICTPFRSLAAGLDQQFDTLVDTAQVVLWPKKRKEDREKCSD